MGFMRFGERQIFQVPQGCVPVGYGWIAHHLGLETPLPDRLMCSGSNEVRSSETIERRTWRIIARSDRPDDGCGPHLLYALRNEPISLAILDAAFRKLDEKDIAAVVDSKSTGALRRRLWFFYEWLTGRTLPIPDAKGNYIPALDPDAVFTVSGENSRRHRIVNNLPGVPGFCPLVFRTDRLKRMSAEDFGAKMASMIGVLPPLILARTANHLYTKESRTSFAIEGERPVEAKLQTFARLLNLSGTVGLDEASLTTLQNMIVDRRFKEDGFRRTSQVYVGDDAAGVHLIGARPADTRALMVAWADAVRRNIERGADPVIAAAVASFGFINIHPFDDGNGRISRFLIHHVLRRMGYGPMDGVFPVSAPILRQLDSYHRMLDTWSVPAMALIDWHVDDAGQMTVRSETAHLYRYFDATAFAEFLYGCVERTVDDDMPRQIDFIQRYDAASRRIEAIAPLLPDNARRLVIAVVVREGRLSNNARKKDPLARLSADEQDALEVAVVEAFKGYDAGADDRARSEGFRG